MSSCTAAARAAASICAGVASGRARAMFSATVAENRNGSCGTQAMPARSAARVKSGSAVPPQVMWPCAAGHWRSSSFTSVLLPAPVGPTRPSVCPAGRSKPTPASAGCTAPG